MRVHFIAIGGSAMHNLAMALSDKGYEVSGSDDAIFEPSKSRLEKRGLLPESFGWDASRITNELDAIVLGMHAKQDNPELLKAQELGIKIYSYPEFLYEQSKHKTRVVIGGSHGKTTITSMILHVLNYHDIDVDYMVGAQLEGFDTMVKLTDYNEFMILEGDEYLASPIDRRSKFHLYKPNIALISGIAWDHVNVFPTLENYVEQFETFIKTITNGGAIIYCEEDAKTKRVVETGLNPIKPFPYRTPEYFIQDNQTFLETMDGPIPLEIFGKHNLTNLEGARLICNQMGVTDEQFYEAIPSFSGASKRLELVKRTPEHLVFKDFAHSPSKVEATTNATKEQFNNKKVIACLELHTYSSLQADFIVQYQGTLDKADEAIVFYSPEAVALKGLENIDADYILSNFKKEGLRVFTDPKELEKHLAKIEKNNAVLLMMSSGNYGGLDLNSL